jgi:hypothetical protein
VNFIALLSEDRAVSTNTQADVFLPQHHIIAISWQELRGF